MRWLSDWTSVRRPNAKSHGRKRKWKTLCCLKKKHDARIRLPFDPSGNRPARKAKDLTGNARGDGRHDAIARELLLETSSRTWDSSSTPVAQTGTAQFANIGKAKAGI